MWQSVPAANSPRGVEGHPAWSQLVGVWDTCIGAGVFLFPQRDWLLFCQLFSLLWFGRVVHFHHGPVDSSTQWSSNKWCNYRHPPPTVPSPAKKNRTRWAMCFNSCTAQWRLLSKLQGNLVEWRHHFLRRKPSVKNQKLPSCVNKTAATAASPLMSLAAVWLTTTSSIGFLFSSVVDQSILEQ